MEEKEAKGMDVDSHSASLGHAGQPSPGKGARQRRRLPSKPVWDVLRALGPAKKAV